jgi:hypothetical protein
VDSAYWSGTDLGNAVARSLGRPALA